jgi:hypothetical protein
MKVLKVGVVVGLTLWASQALGQPANPVVAPFPLEIARPSTLTFAQREELNGTFRVLLRRAGARTPDAAMLQRALATPRTDCARDDGCLAQLARDTGALYAVFASVKLTTEGEVVANGRVVRDDGKLVALLPVGETVKVPKGRSPFPEAAAAALKVLVERLDVRHLSPSRPVEPPPPVVTAAPPVATAPPEARGELPAPPPPPPLLTAATASSGTAGKALVIVGGAAAVAGAIVGGVGLAMAADVHPTPGGSVVAAEASTVRTSRALKTAGAVTLGLGAAAAVLGGILWATSPQAPLVYVSPRLDGAVVGLEGRF